MKLLIAIALLVLLLSCEAPKPTGCRLGCPAARCVCRERGRCDCEPDADCTSCGACDARPAQPPE